MNGRVLTIHFSVIIGSSTMIPSMVAITLSSFVARANRQVSASSMFLRDNKGIAAARHKLAVADQGKAVGACTMKKQCLAATSGG
ncbi:hypothetical protein [Rhizobium sp. M1]|uniref:hypothetical protein n=1 Tax=Rhizobium sp. M1 TaxID=2035453 RepID=UPI001142AD52|nr:hypothetical protein [Rhizobium sp. M1]